MYDDDCKIQLRMRPTNSHRSEQQIHTYGYIQQFSVIQITMMCFVYEIHWKVLLFLVQTTILDVAPQLLSHHIFDV